jgi:hypothetical protein
MAVHKGSEGAVYVGSNQVAEVRSATLTETAETIDSTVMGDTSRTYESSLKTASGTVTCFWDETDTTGQEALDAGAEVTLNLYFEGNASGDTYASFSAIVTEASVSTSLDGLVERTFNFQVNGAVNWSTVA